MVKTKKIDFKYAKGRRKTASARIRLYRGKGESTVNGKPIGEYFSGVINKDLWARPFKIVDVSDKYYVTVKVAGGGLRGQVEAVTLGIARALAKERLEFRKPLKDAGLLTRDARVRQRRMIGMGGKARRKKQSPKR
ncbi:30S ribosomal protein S9 [Candidatus Woesebacteria bacterium RIFCSPLOWO2_01_FULL_37_19]|uniref:30S ribosomal protein S9 n=2 Tax=Candidatus Woeseibacteriota TaxID=1752722 RepID=A0A1F8B2C4_9BACT|nr:MAG: 30S ribosomal protein S9 [Candidatus Woesebacteria bacterium RIFCSPHIGHO2_01_FULL_38_26b]OGM58137.1 MAG: 30S ribosomal protein S9 [Candidatus Woesebacteria bacterium RIFCSPLOWO2_01_FULL_37_19]